MKKMNSIYRLSMYMLLVLFIFSSCSDDDTEESKYPLPSITEFSPSEGFPTSVVTIKGSEFGSERTERIGRVYFGGVEATEYVSWSDDEIQVRVPDGGKSGPITLWVWKNHTETESEFTCLPGAEVTELTPNIAFPGSTITMSVANLQTFIDKGLVASDILVSFPTEDSTTTVQATELTSSTISVEVPYTAKGGTLTVDLGGMQKVTTPSLTLVGDYKFTLTDYVECGGKISINEDGIGSTKNGAWVIYKFTAPATGIFDIYSMTATTKNGSYSNVDIDKDLNTLKNKALDDRLTQPMPNTGSWVTDVKETYGPFYLVEGQEYYLKYTFITASTSWVGNLHELGMSLSSDQTQTPVNGQGDANADYVLYQNNFNSGSSYLPFVASWAWAPSYIKMVDGSLEFYFNQAALDADNRRERKGCEVTCDFKTTSEGWYGFKIYLPEGKFPKDVTGSVIAQIFNAGNSNTWAGHLKINNEKLGVSYRGSSAASAEVDKDICTISWGQWIPIVMYFKAGRNSKGNIKVWVGDDMTESNPTFDSGGINFGFGNWIDDNTLDDNDSGNYKGASLGAKFGLYVSSGGDRTIRFDDLKALEDNPANAFNLVKP